MKKIICLVSLLFIFTACSKPDTKLLTTTCTLNDGGMNLEMVIHHDNKKIKSYDSNTTLDFNGIASEEDLVKQMNVVEKQYKEVDGYTFSYSIDNMVIKQTLSVDLAKIDVSLLKESLTASGLNADDYDNYESFIESTKQSGLDCK